MNKFFNYKLWHNRGYLPHFKGNEQYQFITYRLADSLPTEQFTKLQLKGTEL